MTANVTALLVSHDGSRWLPSVLDGLRQQSRQPDRVQAVESGTQGESLAVLHARLGSEHVVELPERATFGEAVRGGLDGLAPQPNEWVWILHDDSRPSETCLEALLEVAESHPSADVIGPKLREWPSLRRLLELGVTITGTGLRETGLERGEYDQGQHDAVRQVLAVNTAGMLVRREVVDALGFDDQLPVAGADLDFGWRAARAGYTTVVAPEAVVFHAEAAHRGLRRTPHTARIHRAEREAAFYVLIANESRLRLHWVGIRLVIWGVIHAMGLVLLRAPGEAVDEVLALARTFGRPLRILRARRARKGHHVVDPRSLRHLFPPWWLPLRHGVDIIVDAGSALVVAVFDFRPANRPGGWDDADEEVDDAGALAWIQRILRSPVFLLIATLSVAALIASRGLWGGFPVGGALPPVSVSASGLVHAYLEAWHSLGVGSSAPAAPYLVPLAAMGALLGGHVDWVVQALLLLSVPLAGLGALRFAERHIPSVITGVWAAATYALVPVVTGAVQQGRLGTVVFAVVLPHLATTVMTLVVDTDHDRRTRALWRSSLWLALAAAFAPVVLVLSVAAWVVAAIVEYAVRRTIDWALLRTGAVIAVAFALLAPWSLLTWFHAGPGSWLTEAGWRAPELIGPLGRLDLLLARPGQEGAPAWLTFGLLLPALAAGLRVSMRQRAIAGWSVLVFSVVAGGLLSHAMVAVPGGTEAAPIWVGTASVITLGAAAYLAAIAGAGIRTSLSGRSFGWRQPLGLGLVGLAALVPVATAAWWVGTGSGGPLTVQRASGTPAYLVEAGRHRPLDGTLRLEGTSDTSFTYLVQRGDFPGLGSEAVLPSAADQEELTATVRSLTAGVTPADVETLASFGVRFIFLPAPADPTLAADLDAATSVLGPSSSLRPGSRAWELLPAATGASIDRSPDASRGWTVALQLSGIAVVIVLAAPGRRRAS